MWVASPWGFSEMTIQPARHECYACCPLQAEKPGIQPVVGNTHGIHVEQVVSPFQKILMGSQLTWYSVLGWVPCVQVTSHLRCITCLQASMYLRRRANSHDLFIKRRELYAAWVSPLTLQSTGLMPRYSRESECPVPRSGLPPVDLVNKQNTRGTEREPEV